MSVAKPNSYLAAPADFDTNGWRFEPNQRPISIIVDIEISNYCTIVVDTPTAKGITLTNHATRGNFDFAGVEITRIYGPNQSDSPLKSTGLATSAAVIG